MRKINAIDSDIQSMTSELVSLNNSVDKVQVIDDYSLAEEERGFDFGSSR